MGDDIINAIGDLIAKEQEFEAVQVRLSQANQESLELAKKLEDKDRELRELCMKLDDSERRSEEKERSENEALKELELISSQLKQVQEQLEYYFLLSRKQSEMLEASSKLQERMAILLSDASR